MAHDCNEAPGIRGMTRDDDPIPSAAIVQGTRGGTAFATLTKGGTLLPGCVAAIALTALLGWVLDVPLLTSWAAGFATLKPMTALSFLVLVLALRMHDAGHLDATVWLSGAVAVIALLSFAQDVTGFDLRIDAALVPRTALPGPGGGTWRMAPVTALMFTAAAMASGALSNARGHWLVPLLAAAIVLVAGGELAMLLLSGPRLYGVPGFSSVALPAMLAFPLFAAELFRRRPFTVADIALRLGVRLGLSGWLLALVLAAMLPVLLFAGVASQRLATAEHQALLDEMEQRTEAMGQSVERYLRSARELAVMLASDPGARAQDLSGFYTFAKGAVAAALTDRAVVLVAPDGTQLFNTRVPFGTKLPPYGSPRTLAETLAKKAPVLSDLFVGRVSNTYLFNMTAPVTRDGEVSAVISHGGDVSDFTALLLEERLPEGWIGALLDGNGVIVARTRDAATYTGRTASRALLAARAAGERGPFNGLSIDGIAVVGHFMKLPESRWTVAIALPTALLEAPLANTRRFMLSLGLISLVIAGGIAFLIGHHMRGQVEAVTDAARAVGEGKAVSMRPSSVREFAALAGALTAAHGLIEARETALRDSEARFRLFVEHAPAALAMFDRDMRYLAVSRRWMDDFGLTASPVGRVQYEVFSTFGKSRAALHQRCLAGAVERSDGERFTRADGTETWLKWEIRPWTGADGVIGGLLISSEDVTERKRSEEHKTLLMSEVNHRAKNLLAVVTAVARQTSGGQQDPKVFAKLFRDRLLGLAASHDLLVQGKWLGVGMDDLLRSQLAHFAGLIGTRVILDGPAVRINPAAAQAIGMAVHELATNAAKHGALSTASATGAVRVNRASRAGEAGDRFAMEWSEHGGPPCASPAHRGFGHTVLVAMAEHALGATVSLAYPETGLTWRLVAPSRHIHDFQEN